MHPSHLVLALTAALALACSDHGQATEGENGTSDAGDQTWDPGAPGADCPEFYDPDGVYALLQRPRYPGSSSFFVIDTADPPAECSYQFDSYFDAEDDDISIRAESRAPVIPVRRNRRFLIVSIEPDPLGRVESENGGPWFWQPKDWWNPVSNDDIIAEFEIDESFCDPRFYPSYPDGAVNVYCRPYGPYWDEQGEVPDVLSDESTIMLPDGRRLGATYPSLSLVDADGTTVELQDPASGGTTAPANWKIRAFRVLDDRVYLLAMRQCPSFACEGYWLERWTFEDDELQIDGEYVWTWPMAPDEIDRESEQMGIDADGRYLAHIQTTEADGTIYETIVRGDFTSDEILFQEPLMSSEEPPYDEESVKILRFFSGD